jgi:hypothetical protein
LKSKTRKIFKKKRDQEDFIDRLKDLCRLLACTPLA